MTNIKAVNSRKLFNKFIGFPYKLYNGDKNYVPELRISQREILNRKKNPFFQHSEAEYFLALSEKGDVVGRIAAIINDNYIKHWNENFGFFGFFECEDNQDTANLLFQNALEWLNKK